MRGSPEIGSVRSSRSARSSFTSGWSARDGCGSFLIYPAGDFDPIVPDLLHEDGTGLDLTPPPTDGARNAPLALSSRTRGREMAREEMFSVRGDLP